jgi:hypothetical protein
MTLYGFFKSPDALCKSDSAGAFRQGMGRIGLVSARYYSHFLFFFFYQT